MAVNLVKTANRIVNLAHVGSINRDQDGRISIHYAIPRAGVPVGITYQVGTSPPVATDHYVEHVQQPEADEIWNQITSA